MKKIRARKGRIYKKSMRCKDGPFKKYLLWLESGQSLPLNIKGEIGYYSGSKDAGLFWVKL